MIWLARSSARRRRRRRRRYEWRACRGRPWPSHSARWCGDRRVEQLVISVLCLLPAARAAVAHAELVALRVGHDHPPVAVLGPRMSVKTARADPFEAFDLGVDVGCLDVEVHAVLSELGFADSLQEELGQRP